MFDDPMGEDIEAALAAEGYDLAPTKPRKRKPKQMPAWVRAVAGDTWTSLADHHIPNEVDGAARLAALNGNKPLRAGAKVFLK